MGNIGDEIIYRLNQLTGKKFRLPTEAEWEFAARGGTKSAHYKYSGSNDINAVAWYSKNAQTGGSLFDNSTRVVKTKKPNELGIYDMSGNVREWCADRLGKYTSAAQTNPKGPDSGPLIFVCRGGSFNFEADLCRVSCRDGSFLHSDNFWNGLRLVLEP